MASCCNFVLRGCNKMTELKEKARELAVKDWPKAFPYGRARWVEENWTLYVARAKEILKPHETTG